MSPADAALVEGLYEAKVSIENQSIASQRRAVRTALQNVLVKVSGNQELLGHEQIRANVRKAQDYLRSYRFETAEGQLLYLADFDQQSVKKMILDAGFPIWDSRRPDSLIWLAIEDEITKQRQILSEFSSSPLIEEAKQVAEKRGIPISFPILDLTDRQSLRLFDIWGQFGNVINAGSQRYGVDYVLSARIYKHVFIPTFQEPDLDYEYVSSWVADYLLIHKDTVVSETLLADSPELLSQQLVTMLADLLANRYAIDFSGLQSDDSHVDIVITNIQNLTQYVEVYNFLTSLSVVAKANLINQNGQNATFSLDLLGDTQDLLNALRLDNKIRPTIDEFGQEKQNLHYLWVP